jgi:hypothetical protein
MNKNKVQGSIFIILVVVIGVLGWLNRAKFHQKTQVKSSVVSQSGNQPSGSDFPVGSLPADNAIYGKNAVDLPLQLSNPSEGSALLHYFINGVVKEIKNTPQGPQIILTSANTKLPAFIVAKDTRISKISPPYGQQNSVPMSVTDLKSGSTIIISTEYDLAQKVWLLRDVLFPTDRN